MIISWQTILTYHFELLLPIRLYETKYKFWYSGLKCETIFTSEWYDFTSINLTDHKTTCRNVSYRALKVSISDITCSTYSYFNHILGANF